jgi:cytokinin dehydrogenase
MPDGAMIPLGDAAQVPPQPRPKVSRRVQGLSSINRRQFITGLAATAVVIGYDPIGRRWLGRAEASGCASFAEAPRLDGTLLLDALSCQADASDMGNIAHRTPCAVLRPGSVEDIRRMLQYCRRYGIKVSPRGQGRTMHGQSLSDGLVIEQRSLNKIHSIGPDGARVDAGVLWRDVLEAAHDQGLVPPVLTGGTELTVGGTLSVGGISRTNSQGAQVDRVQELEVVTGAGDVLRCSADQNRDLFEVALGGLGQCAIITGAKLDLVPVKQMARTYDLHYTDNATFFRDLRTLLNRGELNDIVNLWLPPGATGLVYQLQATVFFDASNPPDDAHLMRGLSLPPAAVAVSDSSYLDYAHGLDRIFNTYRATAAWDDLLKPWFDVCLPERTVEGYVAEVIPTLTPHDVGPTGFLLLIPQRRSKLTRPFFRVPEADGGDWVYMFHILTSSALPGPDPVFVSEMLERNRRLFDKARQAGATRYPIGAIEFGQADWISHYGPMWPQLVECKRRYDPDSILTPGPGIFGSA